jgi:dipeptidyl-peptidase 4
MLEEREHWRRREPHGRHLPTNHAENMQYLGSMSRLLSLSRVWMTRLIVGTPLVALHTTSVQAQAATPPPASAAATPRATAGTDRERLTLERITMGPSYTGAPPSSPAWSPNSATLAFLWNPPGQPGRTLWLVNRTGEQLRRLLPAENTAAVSEFAWMPQSAALLIVQRGQLALVSLATGTVTALPAGANVADIAPSPDGTQVAFLRDGDLWVMPVSGGTPVRATTVAVAPIGTVPLGTYFRRDVEIGGATWSGPSPAFEWSPDSRSIALHYVDRRAVPVYGMPYFLGEAPLLNRVRRGAPGQVNEVRKVGWLDVATRSLRFIELPDSSRTRIVSFAWSPQGVLLIDRESDDAIDRTMHLVTAATAAPKRIWHDHRESRVYTEIASVWSADGKSIIMTGDLDDRYRLYRLTPGDSTPVLLTPGPQDVAGEAIARAATRSIDYLSSAPRPSERHLFRLSANGGTPRQLTTRPGTHTPFVSPDGRTVALLSSSDLAPTELFLLDATAGAKAAERQVTTSTPATFASLSLVTPQYVSVPRAGDSLPLRVRLLLPPQLDSTKRYPVLFGPVYSNTVRNRWGGANGLLQQYLAVEKGYIVAQVDVRGSTGYGRAFREAFLMDWGGGDLEDLETVVRYLQSQRYVDPKRFGIWGSSYGGTLTVYSLLRKPGLFQAGVAAAAAVDPALFGSDDVAIVRRPQSHPEAFKRGALQYAGNLRDHLLLIHGMQDDVVPFASVVTLAEEFMRLGKDFDFAFAPAATHGWTQRPYYARYLMGKLVDHFDRFLGGGPR